MPMQHQLDQERTGQIAITASVIYGKGAATEYSDPRSLTTFAQLESWLDEVNTAAIREGETAWRISIECQPSQDAGIPDGAAEAFVQGNDETKAAGRRVLDLYSMDGQHLRRIAEASQDEEPEASNRPERYRVTNIDTGNVELVTPNAETVIGYLDACTDEEIATLRVTRGDLHRIGHEAIISRADLVAASD